MKKELSQEIEIPEGVTATLEGSLLTVKGPEGENSREFSVGKVDFEVKDNKIILSHPKATKREKKTINTTASHVKNMVEGVQKKFEYVVKVCSSHFPMTATSEGSKVVIKNFLGEKIPREAKVPAGVNVDIQKDIITITSTSKELAGQTAANLEKATKAKGRDRRIFQDGLYIVTKNGKEM